MGNFCGYMPLARLAIDEIPHSRIHLDDKLHFCSLSSRRGARLACGMNVADPKFQQSIQRRKESMLMSLGTGSRCRTKKLIAGTTGVIHPATEGVIAYEVENLGRQLIAVRWSDSLVTYVFPDEIEIADDDSTPALH
jgi:hypothetical protein